MLLTTDTTVHSVPQLNIVSWCTECFVMLKISMSSERNLSVDVPVSPSKLQELQYINLNFQILIAAKRPQEANPEQYQHHNHSVHQLKSAWFFHDVLAWFPLAFIK